MRKIILFCSLLFSLLLSKGQNSEVGFFMGVSCYIGDLNPTTLFAKPHLAGGIMYRYNFNPRWAFRANIMFANVEGSDAATNAGYERNLSFRSPITEISALAELNFFNIYNQSGRNRITPYIFAGFAVFSFNPQAEYDGVYYALQHLGTEGQGLPGEKKFYNLTSFAIPFGIGVKVNVGKHISFGVEWGMRYTFTDYLDDVGGTYYDNELLAEQRGDIVAALADRSEKLHPHGTGRGNSTTKDIYHFVGGSMTFKFGNSDQACEMKRNAKIKHKIGKKY